jgi:hypothetical protein
MRVLRRQILCSWGPLDSTIGDVSCRADNATKLVALTQERDAAVTAARGGTLWRRLHRNALWFVLGEGAGAATLCATGHCR